GSAGGTLAAPLRHRRAVPSGHRRSPSRRTRAGDRRGACRVAALLRWGADEYPGGHRGCVGDALTSAARPPRLARLVREAGAGLPPDRHPPAKEGFLCSAHPNLGTSTNPSPSPWRTSFQPITSTATWRDSST